MHRALTGLSFLFLAAAPAAFAGPAATYSGNYATTEVPVWAGGSDTVAYTFVHVTGWYFVPASDVTVTALGVMDFGDPGLHGGHKLAIYENTSPSEIGCIGCYNPRSTTGTLVVGTGIGAGLSGNFVSDGTRWVTLDAPITLTAGTEYYIVGDGFGCDPNAYTWFGLCAPPEETDEDDWFAALNATADLSAFGSTAINFDAGLSWTGYANAYDGESVPWQLYESYKVGPGLGVKGNVGPNFWILDEEGSEEDPCTHDEDYWNTDDVGVWPDVDGVVVGGRTVGQSDAICLLNDSDTSPTTELARAVLVTELNIANGTSPYAVSATLEQANACLAAETIPCLDDLSEAELAPCSDEQIDSLLTTLHAYIEGCIGPGACDEDGDGWTVHDGDCDDDNPNVHPDQEEIDNDLDDDCDGEIDEWIETPDPDDDDDGWDVEEDCNDGDPTIHPNAEEKCDDGVDQDCDGQIDEGCEPVDDGDPLETEEPCDEDTSCGCNSPIGAPGALLAGGALVGLLAVRRRRR